MKGIMFDLKESTQEVDGAIYYLEGIIKRLKAENKLSPSITNEITNFYSTVILPYMEYYYTSDKEIDDQYTRLTINDILDLANTLDNI